LAERGGAIGGVVLGVGEVEGAENVGGRVKGRDDLSPRNVFSGVGGVPRGEEDAGTVVIVVGGTERVGVPFGPPTGCNVGKMRVGGVAGIKVAVVKAGRVGVNTEGIETGLGEVNRDEVPTGPEGAGVKVRNKEEPIGRGKDRGGKGGPGRGARGWVG
jgi:hypothetical protein